MNRNFALVVLILSAPVLIHRSIRADELASDFRSTSFDNSLFQMAGPQAEECLEPTSNGLRIKLLDGKNHEPTGIALRSPLHGDFEMVVSYEIKLLTPPTTGYGVGVGFYVETNSATKEALTLERFVFPKEGEIFAATRGTTKNGQREYTGNHFPARGSRVGKLRMTRRGKNFTVAVVDGTDPSFRDLQTFPINGEDVVYVRLAGDTGGFPGKLDALLRDFRITTSQPAADVVDAPPPPGSFLARNWPILLTVIIALTAVAVIAVARRRVDPGDDA